MAQPLHFDSLGQYSLSSTNNKTFLYKYNLKYPLLKLNLSSSSKKTAFCFFDNDTIVSGSSDGNIEFISTCRNTTLKTIHLFTKNIKQIIQIPNTNYLIVHANTDTMAIVDAKSYKIVHTRYREFKQVVQNIELLDTHNLHVTLKGGKTIDIELPSCTKLRSLILHNSVKEAFELVEKEPMLTNSLEYKNLEENFNKAYKKAIDALSIGNKHLANFLIDIYRDVSSKQESLKLLFKSFEEYDRFQTLYKERKYAICYPIALKYTPLKMTKEYMNMEKIWEKLSIIATNEVQEGNIEAAKTILVKFITINSKRADIQNILSATKQNTPKDKLNTLQTLYEKDDFFECYEYIDLYPELYHSELGVYLQKHYMKLINSCEDYAIDGNIRKIISTLGSLIKLPKRKERAEALLKASFLIKIEKQLSISDFNTSQRLIYTYIDIFDTDSEISSLMREYEEISKEKLAITLSDVKSDWLNSDFM